MFVLERLLRGLSEDSNELSSSASSSSATVLPQISRYQELIENIKDLRESPTSKIDSEYYQEQRLLIDFNVEGAVKEIREFRNLPDNLKILLFAHDNKMSIFKDDSIDWIGVIKRLMDQIEENEGLIIRVLRYLKCKYEETSGLMESVPLLLMNTFNKMLSTTTNTPKDILFVLQAVNLVKLDETSGLEHKLLLLLRSSDTNRVNDRIKAMIIRVLRDKLKTDTDEIERMLSFEGDGGSRMSAVISAELGKECGNKRAPLSSSKVVNFLNGHFEEFSAVERTVLVNDSINTKPSNGYERFLLGEAGSIDDPNVLRELFRQGKVNLDLFLEKMRESLEIEDYEMISCKAHAELDILVFWKFLDKIPFLTKKIKELWPNRKFYSVDREALVINSSSSLPVLYHFFKILVEFRDLEEAEVEDWSEDYIEMAGELYEKYKIDKEVAEVFKNVANKQEI